MAATSPRRSPLQARQQERVPTEQGGTRRSAAHERRRPRRRDPRGGSADLRAARRGPGRKRRQACGDAPRSRRDRGDVRPHRRNAAEPSGLLHRMAGRDRSGAAVLHRELRAVRRSSHPGVESMEGMGDTAPGRHPRALRRHGGRGAYRSSGRGSPRRRHELVGRAMEGHNAAAGGQPSQTRTARALRPRGSRRRLRSRARAECPEEPHDHDPPVQRRRSPPPSRRRIGVSAIAAVTPVPGSNDAEQPCPARSTVW